MSRLTPLRWVLLAGLVALPAGSTADASDGAPAETAQKEKKEKKKKKSTSSKKKKKDDSKKKKKKGDQGDQGNDRGDRGNDRGDLDNQDNHRGNQGAQGNQGANRPAPRKAPNPGARVQATHKRPVVGPKVKATKRSFDPRVKAGPPLHRTKDHRYARPKPYRLTHHPRAHHAPPRFRPYRSYYSRWWVHPYFRWQHATLRLVLFPFAVAAWAVDWTPDYRPGWIWAPGLYVGGVWRPGHWRPAGHAPVHHVHTHISYVYVPGWWVGDAYVEGYYRADDRDDGDWEWVEGYYLDDGTYVRGHWVPGGPPPEGMTWEPGFFDGEEWVEGFWRPGLRSGFRWISAYYDAEGVYHSGYWEPITEQAGAVWVPGWFDGNGWQEGYWVPTEEYESINLSSWEPEPGYDAGWEDEEAGFVADADEPPPLAMPVTFGEEDFEE